MQALAVGCEIAALADVRLERRVDREEPAVGEKAVSAAIGAVRLVAEEERLAAEQVRQGLQVGEAADVGLLRRVAADALVVVALGVVGPGPFQRLWRELVR